MKRLLQTVVVAVFSAILTGAALGGERPANDPNAYSGSDSERIARAVAASAEFGGLVRVPARVPDAEADRDFWLLDSAILLPGDTTLSLENCVLKLSDACRDNFIRSANCGVGIEKVKPTKNIRIVGVGRVELIGADRPRATGDSAKRLGERTFGTDAGKEGESQNGDWRNIGVLLAAVDGFTIENITIKEAHCWAISLERCSNGRVADVNFFSSENRTIDGKAVKTLNQDGLDLRKGCKNIHIENISGQTGDDLIALTAISNKPKVGGQLNSTEVSDWDATQNGDIFNVSIRGVVGYSAGGHQIVRLLNASGLKIYNVSLDGVVDSSPEGGVRDRATVRIGDANPAWGGVTPLGDTTRIAVRNVVSRSNAAVLIAGSLTDSVVMNVVNRNPARSAIVYESGRENVRNVVFLNCVDAPASETPQK